MPLHNSIFDKQNIETLMLKARRILPPLTLLMLAFSLQISLSNETLLIYLILNVSLPLKWISFERKDTVYCLSSTKSIDA
jgi:hypothetical protein